MMLYKMMLVLVIFGAVAGMFNSLNLYTQKVPDDGNRGLSEAEVVDLTNQMSNAPLNPFTAYFMLTTLIRIIGSVALSLVTIIPFLVAWGVHPLFALAIQTPIWLVMAWGLYEIWTGHTPPAQD